MKAKKTTEAAVKMPMTPKFVGSYPKRSWTSGESQLEPPPSGVTAGGMKGL